MSAFLAFLAGLPSAFWQSCISLMKSTGTFIAGVKWQRLIQQAAESKKLNEQLADILKVEKEVNHIPIAGAAQRLRNSRLFRTRERGIL